MSVQSDERKREGEKREDLNRSFVDTKLGIVCSELDLLKLTIERVKEELYFVLRQQQETRAV